MVDISKTTYEMWAGGEAEVTHRFNYDDFNGMFKRQYGSDLGGLTYLGSPDHPQANPVRVYDDMVAFVPSEARASAAYYLEAYGLKAVSEWYRDAATDSYFAKVDWL